MNGDSHTLHNPITGHSVRFLQTADESDGELLSVEYGVAQPEARPQIPLHLHWQTEERFLTTAGRLGVLLNGETLLLAAGERVTIPPGAAHTFWNAGPGALRFITEVRPPGGFQTYWETVFGLAAEGKVGRNGLPSLPQLALLAPLADSYDPRLPPGVSRALLGLLGGIGRALGYRASYPRFSRPPRPAAQTS